MLWVITHLTLSTRTPILPNLNLPPPHKHAGLLTTSLLKPTLKVRLINPTERSCAERIVASGYIRSYIIFPPTVYSIACTPLTATGIQNAHSIQIPGLIKACITRCQGGKVGEGKNIWSNIDINDRMSIFS